MRKVMLLGLALIPSIAWAAGNAGDNQDKKRSGMICRELEETGSRLSTKRICMTKEQWEAARRDARQAVEQAQTRQWNPKGS
jgi:nicotinamide mononucleotide (NMN) deamidase PncC